MSEPLKIGRFTFIAGAVLAPVAMASCGETPPPASPEGLKRTDGVWTPEEIQKVAASMANEDTRLNTIVYAGNLLLANGRGERVLSNEAPFFVENRLGINTKSDLHLDRSNLFQTSQSLAGINMEKTAEKTHVHFTQRGLPPTDANYSYQLKSTDILLNNKYLKRGSDLVLKFFLAKELSNLHAFGLAANFVADAVGVNLPTEEKARNAALVLMLDQTPYIPKYPSVTLKTWEYADMWAHFMVVPDYLVAKEQKRLTRDDLDIIGKTPIDAASQIFLDQGALVRTNDGGYKWSDTSSIEDWFLLTASFQAVSQKVR